jgi:tetratricopeptide (TPR) repeat protein
MSDRQRWCRVLALALTLSALPAARVASAADDVRASTAAPAAAPPNSALDDRLFYQLLVGEIALTQGEAGTAYEWILDAARRTRDADLFRRAVDIALQARAGEQALTATRAWRTAHPDSLDALRLQLQILLALGRPDALDEPLKTLLAKTPASERPGVIVALPRYLHRAGDARRVAEVMTTALAPYRDVPATQVAVRVALAQAWLGAKDADRALALLREAHALDATAPGPALLALELMRERPDAEAIMKGHLATARAEPVTRLAYVRALDRQQRKTEAADQLRILVQLRPAVAYHHYLLGAMQISLKQFAQAEASLLRFLELAQRTDAAAAGKEAHAASDEPDEATQAHLMLAMVAEQRGDFAAAEAWLAKVDDPARALAVQIQRASMLARQGKLEQARAALRATPEQGAGDARDKLLAEAALLRDGRHWQEAHDLLAAASARFEGDTEILYEQAMMAERIGRMDDMERLLRRVIELKPESAHAHNALGYSLADRHLRLPEARQLVLRALELSPGDPFITDSLGWVEFRLGNGAEAARLLSTAYAARPDTEIAAHLGEVLWSLGQQEQARRVWGEAQARDAGNEVLRETLTRLNVKP